jgi:hypothetical protein
MPTGTDDFQRRVATFNAAHGLDDLESDLLYHVWMEQASPAEFVRYVHNLGVSQDAGEDPAVISAGLAALNRLIARSLVTILTAEAIETERARVAASDVPECGRRVRKHPGWVEFTAEGYALRRKMCVALFDAPHDEGGSKLNPERTRFDVYATTASACIERMNRLAPNPNTWGGQKGYVVIERIEPIEIGPWRANQFTLHPRGFHGVLRLGPPPETPAS